MTLDQAKSTAAQFFTIKPSVTWPDGLKVWTECVGIAASMLDTQDMRLSFCNAALTGEWIDL